MYNKYHLGLMMIFLLNKTIAQEKRQYLILDSKYCYENNEKNSQFSESLLLQSDSVFHYHIRAGTMGENITGKWFMTNDTLVLNPENQFAHRIIIREKYSQTLKNGFVRFSVQYLNSEIEPTIVTIKKTNGKTKKVSINNTSIINIRKMYNFTINDRIINYQYDIINEKSNCFAIQINRNSLFIHNKWIIEDGKLYPLMSNDKNYYIKKCR